MIRSDPIIYIVDDDSSVLEALSSLVRSIGFDVVCFSSAADFLDSSFSLINSCLILDVRMPEMSGLDVQREINRIGKGIPIIFISGHADIPMAVNAIKAGAVDFLTKPFREEDLLSAIRCGLNSPSFQSEGGVFLHDYKKYYDRLSKREKEILEFVLNGSLNKQTGLELGISEATVKVHRHNIMRKMNVGSVQSLVRIMEKIKSL